jgi:hypothetical protein
MTEREITERKTQKLEVEQDSKKILVRGLEEFEERVDIKMLLHNHIEGVLPLQVRHIDDHVFYCYRKEEMISLEELLSERTLDYDLAHRLIEDICHLHHMAKDFFLEEEHFVLQPDYLMWHLSEERFFVCYFPGWDLGLSKQIETLSEYLLPKVNHGDKKCVSFCYGIYDLAEKTAALGEIERYLQKNHGENEQKEKTGKEARKSERECTTPTKKRGYYLKKISACPHAPEKIPLEQEKIRIGRQGGEKYYIPGSQISRNHAEMEWENGQLYLTDKHSRNGVFLNGKSLLPEHAVPCQEGDKITFADISYELCSV